ncbi:hypothetical protein [Georgenia satyanarayanai]|uniref:hypothetical protein n=1 Tax=Georgenia satyanarayanai TaxID=860221 RepID=UPI0012641E3C|nr:hypothetical protein [Georgenia satyanarayanai]
MTTTEWLRPAGTGRARRRVLALLLLVALVLGAGLWWWSHPQAFQGPGNSVTASTEPGRSLFLGLAYAPHDADVSLIGVRPRVVADDTPARVTVHVCRPADPYLSVGVSHDHVEDICASLREPTGPLDATDQLVVEVVAQEEGAVVIDGLDVTYRAGVRRGTQWTGEHATVEVGPPGSTP